MLAGRIDLAALEGGQGVIGERLLDLEALFAGGAFVFVDRHVFDLRTGIADLGSRRDSQAVQPTGDTVRRHNRGIATDHWLEGKDRPVPADSVPV